MESKQIIAVLIVMVAVSGIGFAASSRAEITPEGIIPIMEQVEATSTVMPEPIEKVFKDPLVYRETPYILLFKGVAVDKKVESAYLVGVLDRPNGLEGLKMIKAFMFIGDNEYDLKLAGIDIDRTHRTAVLTFKSESEEVKLVIKSYGNGYRSDVFASGSFGSYALNMKLYPFLTKHMGIDPYEKSAPGIAGENIYIGKSNTEVPRTVEPVDLDRILEKLEIVE